VTKIGSFLIAVLCASAAQAGICGQDANTRATEIQISAVQMFALADHLVQEGKPDEAIKILRVITLDKNPDYRNEARFRQAQILTRMHKLAEAAVLYRAILDEKPDVGRVRLELATVFAQMGDLSAAQHEMRQAQAGGLPPEVAQAVDRYVAALRSMKPWGGSFELTLAPDSNINRTTSAKTLDTVIAPLILSDDARERSGLGLKGSGQGYARVDLVRDITLVPRLSGQGAFYRASQFDDVSGSAQIGLEWRLKADKLTPSAGYTWRWYGGNLYARTQSLSLDWLHPAGKKAQLDITGRHNPYRFCHLRTRLVRTIGVQRLRFS
jgi:tetratricopeptide (TPR) repeat protein